MGEYAGVELSGLVLTSERLTMRPWQQTDADAVFEAMQDRRMHEFLPLPDPYTQENAIGFVSDVGDEGRATGTGIGCALVETATNRIVGSAALRLPRPRHVSAEIGYAVYPAGQGNGYAAEASRALANWAFDHGITRVEVICAVANLASVKSAINAGFRFEAVMRGDVFTHAGPVDGAVFARLAEDPGEPIAPVTAPLPASGLTDGTVLVRPLLPGDEQGLSEQESDPVTRQWEFDESARSSALHRSICATARLHWLVGPVLRMTIVDAATGSYAGMINIRLAGPPNVGGIGYAVHPAFRGRGYTARALRLVSAWAFEHGGFARLELGAKEGNIASQKAALSGGFSPDGVREARLRNPDGTFADEIRFAAVNPAVARPNTTTS
jgi:RimJ/RimL family protein N-acetyltransferase